MFCQLHLKSLTDIKIQSVSHLLVKSYIGMQELASNQNNAGRSQNKSCSQRQKVLVIVTTLSKVIVTAGHHCHCTSCNHAILLKLGGGGVADRAYPSTQASIHFN